MTTALRRNRKASDQDVVRYNSLGFSLSWIAKTAGCVPSAISLRLKLLNITPADTRHSFMEQVFAPLSEQHREAVADILESTPHMVIQDYVRSLITRDIEARRQPAA